MWEKSGVKKSGKKIKTVEKKYGWKKGGGKNLIKKLKIIIIIIIIVSVTWKAIAYKQSTWNFSKAKKLKKIVVKKSGGKKKWAKKKSQKS